MFIQLRRSRCYCPMFIDLSSETACKIHLTLCLSLLPSPQVGIGIGIDVNCGRGDDESD